MKRKLLIIFLASTFNFQLSTFNVTAQSPTASPTAKPKIATPSPTTDSKISELKERIASRVAQLNLVEKKGILGTIASISSTRITLADPQGRTRIIDTDELTQSTKTKDQTQLLLGLSSGNTIGVFGLYNKNSRVLLARFVKDEQFLHRLFGEVLEIDKKTFSVTIKDSYSKSTSAVNIQSTTQTSISVDGKLVKSGFSKIEVGQKVFVVAVPDQTSDTKAYAALRLIILPGPKSAPPTKTPTPTATPSAKTTP